MCVFDCHFYRWDEESSGREWKLRRPGHKRNQFIKASASHSLQRSVGSRGAGEQCLFFTGWKFGVAMPGGRNPRVMAVSSSSYGVTGIDKWAGRTRGGSSPLVRDSDPSNVPRQSSQRVRRHLHARSAAATGGGGWSRRERGRDGDAGGRRKREKRLLKSPRHSLYKQENNMSGMPFWKVEFPLPAVVNGGNLVVSKTYFRKPRTAVL